MLQRLAQPFEDRSWTRVILLVLGIVGTVMLAPMALFGAYSGVVALLFYRDAGDVGMAYRMGAIGLAGVLGMLAAWCRLLIANERYRRSAVLFYSTVVGLVIGIATAVVFFGGAWVSAPSPMFWLALVVVLLGIGLLGATIGARMRPNVPVLPRGTRRSRTGG